VSATPADTSRTDGVVRPTSEPGRRDALLPAPQVQNHAANLAVLPDGSLGCVWFAGTQEGVPDISVWFSRLDRARQAWSEPVQLSDDPGRSEQNPVLHVRDASEVWLLWTSQHAGNQDTARVLRRISGDGGQTWGATHTLLSETEHGGVFVRQPIVVLPTGRLLLPIFHCVRVPGQRWVGDRDYSSVMISDDGGGTWREVVVPASTGCVHMNIGRLSDGTLVALYRSRWADHVYRSTSDDDGETWTEPAPTELPNNNSSIQFTALADGRLALVYNHSRAGANTERRLSLYDEIDDDGLAAEQGQLTEPVPAPGVGAPGAGASGAGKDAGARGAFWGTPRSPMTLAISEDSGRTWPIRRNLDVGDGYCLSNNSRDGLNREYSYPSIHQSPDGALNIAYTYFRQAIKYVRVAPQWAYEGTTTPGGEGEGAANGS